jgi:hypothetical protein
MCSDGVSVAGARFKHIEASCDLQRLGNGAAAVVSSTSSVYPTHNAAYVCMIQVDESVQ